MPLWLFNLPKCEFFCNLYGINHQPSTLFVCETLLVDISDRVATELVSISITEITSMWNMRPWQKSCDNMLLATSWQIWLIQRHWMVGIDSVYLFKYTVDWNNTIMFSLFNTKYSGANSLQAPVSYVEKQLVLLYWHCSYLKSIMWSENDNTLCCIVGRTRCNLFLGGKKISMLVQYFKLFLVEIKIKPDFH